MNALEAIVETRRRLIDSHPFYAMLVLPLELEETTRTKTMDVDGRTLRFNPEWVLTRKHYQLDADLAEEGLHVGLLHPWRCRGRDPIEWNISCDYYVRSRLVADGFRIDDFEKIPEYEGLSADEIYALREAKRRQDEPPAPAPAPEPEDQEGEDQDEDGESRGTDQDEDGQEGDQAGDQDSDGEDQGEGEPGEDGQGSPGEADGQGDGEGQLPDMGDQTSFSPAPDDVPEEDAMINAVQAAYIANKAAKIAGREPGAWESWVNESRDSEVPWQDHLRQWVTKNVVADTTWSRPDRRFIAQGLTLPGPYRENFGRIVFVTDKSGSIDNEALAQVQAEMNAIISEVRPEALVAIWHSYTVERVREFGPDEEIDLSTRAGGGTSFQPVLDYLAQNETEPPVGMIWFTDTYAEDLDRLEDPGYPVLWLVPEYVNPTVPFGTVVKLKKYQ